MNLSDRMKRYELSFKQHIVRRCPAICRLDGRAFHTLTSKLEKPYDPVFHTVMESVAKHLCECIPTAKFAFGQSDEISILLIDYGNSETDAFFDGVVQKLASLIASEATSIFSACIFKMVNGALPAFEEFLPAYADLMFKATFDARVFTVPEKDVNNYFVWRQQDARRNAVQGTAQLHLSAADIKNKSNVMLMDELGERWTSMPESFRNGYMIWRESGATDQMREKFTNAPAWDFSKNAYIEQLVS